MLLSGTVIDELAAYLTGILHSFWITRAQHVIGDHRFTVLRVLPTFLIAHNGHLHFLQDAGRLSIFFNGAPAGRYRLRAVVRFICRETFLLD